MNRRDYEATIASWRAMGIGDVTERATSTYAFAQLAKSSTRADAPKTAAVFAALACSARGVHMGLDAFGDEVVVTVSISRALDAQDAAVTA